MYEAKPCKPSADVMGRNVRPASLRWAARTAALNPSSDRDISSPIIETAAVVGALESMGAGAPVEPGKRK